MRTSIAIATGLVVGSGITAVGALTVPDPYFGSDTLINVTRQAITNAPGLSATQANSFVAGGSAAGQSAMAQSTVKAETQQTAPMTKLFNNSVCNKLGGTNGSAATNASGIVIGMDAVDVLASSTIPATSTCSNSSNPNGQDPSGLAYSGSTAAGVPFANTAGNTQNWKWVLALLYGGLDLSAPAGTLPDCASAARAALVNNWSLLFQNSSTCSNGSANASVCGDSVHLAAGDGTHVPLMHAFRRDDAAGTADVFSSLIGLQVLMPGVSASANNGFGTSPYCNALNWDTNTANNNGGFCGGQVNSLGNLTFGGDDQFVGPGGVPDPNSLCTFKSFATSAVNTAETCAVSGGGGNHRMPPPGTWGNAPAITGNPSNFDVLPTSFQDNDPIRRTCIGTISGGQTGNALASGEEVCNLDGKLGVVLAIPASDFITTITSPAGMVQYPTAACTGAQRLGKPVNVLNCGPFQSATHAGECPDGDGLIGTSCEVPIATSPLTSQCIASKTVSVVSHKRTLNSPDGRVYNLFMRDGDTTDGSIAYIKQTIQNGTSTATVIDFAGGMGRIHTVETVWNDGSVAGNAALVVSSGPPNVGCQMVVADDQIGCLVQADPCSIGSAADDGKTWNVRQNGIVCQTLADQGVCAGTGTNGDQPPYSTSAALAPFVCPAQCVGTGTVGPQSTDTIRIDETYPTEATVTALGSQTIEYQIARKLYFNSLVGFSGITAGTSGQTDTATGELTLAQYEANNSATQINPILANVGFFALPSAATAPYNAPFCEDFNEELICGAAAGAGGTLSNVNGCLTNAGNNSALGVAVNLPSQGSICGNGIQEPYEECDNGTPGVTSGTGTAVSGGNGASGNNCTTACRCAPTFSYDNAGTGFKCQ
ncbi:MAG: hypothetical protein ABSF69_09840 [Polyangiaceae bacterium]|jgi:hypothetical protein